MLCIIIIIYDYNITITLQKYYNFLKTKNFIEYRNRKLYNKIKVKNRNNKDYVEIFP